jgi:hypothetical protein
MELLSKPLEVVKKMSPERRTAYFEQYAGYIPEAPNKCYAIRVGSTTLRSDDTYKLRQMFDHLVHYGTVKEFNDNRE